MDTPIVKIRNLSDTPFRAGWNGQNYVIKPGSEAFASWEAMCLWCGDPNLADTPQERARTKAREYLGVLYGTFDAPWYTDVPHETVHLPHEPFKEYEWDDRLGAYRHPNIPKLEVTDHNGEPIVTILDDPDGNQEVTGRDDTDRAQQDTLAALQATVAQLQAQLSQSNPSAVAASLTPTPEVPPEAPADMPIPEDVPPQARRGRSVKR